MPHSHSVMISSWGKYTGAFNQVLVAMVPVAGDLAMPRLPTRDSFAWRNSCQFPIPTKTWLEALHERLVPKQEVPWTSLISSPSVLDITLTWSPGSRCEEAAGRRRLYYARDSRGPHERTHVHDRRESCRPHQRRPHAVTLDPRTQRYRKRSFNFGIGVWLIRWVFVL